MNRPNVPNTGKGDPPKRSARPFTGGVGSFAWRAVEGSRCAACRPFDEAAARPPVNHKKGERNHDCRPVAFVQGDFEERPEEKTEEVVWSGEPIPLAMASTAIAAASSAKTSSLPAICHPRVRSAAYEVLQAQAKLRDIQGQRATRGPEQQKAELIKAGTGHEVAKSSTPTAKSSTDATSRTRPKPNSKPGKPSAPLFGGREAKPGNTSSSGCRTRCRPRRRPWRLL